MWSALVESELREHLAVIAFVAIILCRSQHFAPAFVGDYLAGGPEFYLSRLGRHDRRVEAAVGIERRYESRGNQMI